MIPHPKPQCLLIPEVCGMSFQGVFPKNGSRDFSGSSRPGLTSTDTTSGMIEEKCFYLILSWEGRIQLFAPHFLSCHLTYLLLISGNDSPREASVKSETSCPCLWQHATATGWLSLTLLPQQKVSDHFLPNAVAPALRYTRSPSWPYRGWNRTEHLCLNSLSFWGTG